MPLTAAEKQKRYREKLKQNQEKYEEAKKKHRERYHKTKRLVKDMTPKERYNANVIWRLRKQDFNKRKTTIQRVLENTPPDSPRSDSRLSIQNETPPLSPAPRSPPLEIPPLVAISPAAATPPSMAKTRGRKKIKKDRSKVYRENKKLIKENEKLKKKYEKYKKRYLRQNDKNKQQKSEYSRYKVLSGAIKKTYKITKSRKERHLIKKIFLTPEVIQSRIKKQLLADNLGTDKVTMHSFCVERRTILKTKIKDFFLRDDISRASAGKKETVTKGKIKTQKRYLLDNMKNLFKTFKTENPDLSCSYFYFTKNKPYYVVRPTVDARDMCMCKTHANFIFKANALKSKGITGTKDTNILIESTVCNANSKDCMYSTCDKCFNKKYNYNVEKLTGSMQWAEWIRKEEKYEKDGKIMKAIKNIKQEFCESVVEFIGRYEKELAAMKKHVFNIKTQFQSYRRCLENIQPNECIVIVDFSENYNCKYSQEIQSHHFGGSRNQISLHTVVVYTCNKEVASGHNIHSFCSVSASNNHQPSAIWSHLDPILKWIKSESIGVNTIHFYSDGPCTQYRQKQNFYLMCTKLFDYEFKAMTWSFFEAGHGKGPADGIGGFLKRTADQIVANGEDIADVSQFYDKMKNVSKIRLHVIEDNDILELQKTLPKVIPRLVGTLKVHQVFTDCRGVLRFRELSCFCEKAISGRRGFCSCLEPQVYDISTCKKAAAERQITIAPLSELPSKSAAMNSFSSDDEAPLISLKVAQNLKDITNTRKSVYEMVYGNSSDDEEPCTSYGKENSKIASGEYLLVKVYVDASKKKAYKYASKALSDFDEDGEIKVMFLRVADKNAKLFRMVEKDISYVAYEDIIRRLPSANIVKRGLRIYYQFNESVEVYEK